MRSEVSFLPPRTSVTDSVGISTLPIFSCKPKALTRDSSDSFTLRSKPEQEGMMYRFIFGFFGASALAAAPSVAAACGSPAAVSFFSSSSIMGLLPGRPLLEPASFRQRIFSSTPKSVSLKIIKQIRHAALDEVVDHGEVQRENEHRDDDDGGCGLHFLP